MTVLVVDDDAAFRDSLRFSLESEGIDVEVASGPQEAVRAISESEFDAVVTDLAMAGDGEHVLDHVQTLRPGTPEQDLLISTRDQGARSLGPTGATPSSARAGGPGMIVLTGHAAESKRRSIARRAHAVLDKPIPTEQLIKLLRNAKKRRRGAKRP